MEDIKEVETQTTNQIEDTVTEPLEKAGEVKTFTQDEIDNIVKERLEREKKKLPSKEELAKFKQWEDNQKTDVEKQMEIAKTAEETNKENTFLKQKLAIADKEVIKEYRNFVQFEVSQMDGDFNDNLEKYLKDNSKYLSEEEKLTTGVKISGQAPQTDGVMDILKAKHPDLY